MNEAFTFHFINAFERRRKPEQYCSLELDPIALDLGAKGSVPSERSPLEAG